jgi:hypothetical protein
MAIHLTPEDKEERNNSRILNTGRAVQELPDGDGRATASRVMWMEPGIVMNFSRRKMDMVPCGERRLNANINP